MTKKIWHKNLVNAHSFLGAKISCMRDHVKLTLQEKNLDHIALHAGTKKSKTENTTSHTAKITMDLVKFLQNNNNTLHCNCVLH